MASQGKKPVRKQSGSTHRSTLSLQKTEILINVYDLLPPGRLSTAFWTLGCSLLHSGVVINDKEYAFGGHDKKGLTGVYWTKPKTEPPGGTFRCEILHGFTIRSEEEIGAIIKQASEEFLGTSYNLLTFNCNHFTSHLCYALTGHPAPSWLNRAASIGLALPCVVPREWIAPPDVDTADGELVDENDEYYDDERSRMIHGEGRRHSFGDESFQDHRDSRYRDSRSEDEYSNGDDNTSSSKGKGKAPVRDTSGRLVPASERAPVPRTR